METPLILVDSNAGNDKAKAGGLFVLAPEGL